MKKLIYVILIFLNIGLAANPVVIVVPVISEFYYNQGNWQIELCIKSDIYEWMDIQNFDQLSVKSDAGQVPIVTNLQFYYDSVYVIDQSWLATTLFINPTQDNLNIIHENWTAWDGISYSPYPDTLVVSTPGEGESIAVHYFYGGISAYPMKQSPPSIGSSVFEVSSRSGISGYVYDQHQNPVPGLSLDYYSSLNSWYPQPIHSLQTDTNGYYESEEIFPMGYYVELKMNNYVLETDMMYFEPDSSYYKEYFLINADIPVLDLFDGIEVSVAPNPFSNETTFRLNIPEEMIWKDAKIAIRNISGQIVDFIPLTVNPWAGGEISADWAPGGISKGIYIYSLVVDGQVVKSGKLITY